MRVPWSKQCYGCPRSESAADCNPRRPDWRCCLSNRDESMPTKIELCSVSDVEPGAVLKVERDDLTLAVFNLDGEFFVTVEIENGKCQVIPLDLQDGPRLHVGDTA